MPKTLAQLKAENDFEVMLNSGKLSRGKTTATKSIVQNINNSKDISTTATAFLLDGPLFAVYQKHPDLIWELTGHYPDFNIRDSEKLLEFHFKFVCRDKQTYMDVLKHGFRPFMESELVRELSNRVFNLKKNKSNETTNMLESGFVYEVPKLTKQLIVVDSHTPGASIVTVADYINWFDVAPGIDQKAADDGFIKRERVPQRLEGLVREGLSLINNVVDETLNEDIARAEKKFTKRENDFKPSTMKRIVGSSIKDYIERQ